MLNSQLVHSHQLWHVLGSQLLSFVVKEAYFRVEGHTAGARAGVLQQRKGKYICHLVFRLSFSLFEELFTSESRNVCECSKYNSWYSINKELCLFQFPNQDRESKMLSGVRGRFATVLFYWELFTSVKSWLWESYDCLSFYRALFHVAKKKLGLTIKGATRNKGKKNLWTSY